MHNIGNRIIQKTPSPVVIPDRGECSWTIHSYGIFSGNFFLLKAINQRVDQIKERVFFQYDLKTLQCFLTIGLYKKEISLEGMPLQNTKRCIYHIMQRMAYAHEANVPLTLQQIEGIDEMLSKTIRSYDIDDLHKIILNIGR